MEDIMPLPRMTREEFLRQRDKVRNPDLVAIRTDMGGAYIFLRQGLDVLVGITGQLRDGTHMEIPFEQIVSVCEPDDIMSPR
ncbi:MAG: hypothetical protein V1848_01550 [Candidatus Magasanikbacteria bacterium]